MQPFCHQQRKHQEVSGQQALERLITHTTAKRQGSKVAHSHHQPPHMCLLRVKMVSPAKFHFYVQN